MSRRLSRKNEAARKEEKENEEIEEKKLRVEISNRSRAAKAQAWEEFVSYQAGPFHKSDLKCNICVNHEYSQKTKL